MKFRTTSIFYLLFLLLGAVTASASGEVAQTFTLDGRLYADAAATTPLTDPDVTIVLQILNPAQSCILYEETQTHFDASIGNGFFTLQIGSAVGTAKRSSLDSAHAMSLVYTNSVASISGRTIGGGACSYSPTLGDLRYIRMQVTPSSDHVARILSPSMPLDAVPMAVVAERAESVQGLGAANILQVNTTGSEVLSQANLESIFSSSNYTALTALLAGSSSLYSKPAANGTTPLANVTSPASPSAGQMWYDSGAIKFYDGSSTQTLGTAGAGISSVVAGTGLNVGAGPGGAITSTGTLNVDTGTTTGKIVQVAASNKLPVIDGSNLTNLPAPTSVSGSAITSGTIGGSTAINTSGVLTTSGNITGATITGTSVVGTTGSFGSTSTGQLSLYDNAVTSTNYVTLKTPNTATLTADYTLTLPSALPGVAGQVLTSDTSGNLTWTSPSSGSVVSVGGTAPVTVTGTASAPIVNVSAATTSASGVVTLAANGGVTPSTVVQATDSRLTDSRAPNGTASGDLSNSYPNPTVSKINGKTLSYGTFSAEQVLQYDGTNWTNAALSSASLSNDSNLLKASNMPANCASGSSLTFSSPTGTWICTVIPDATASSKGIMQVGTGLAVSSGTVSLTSGVVTAGTYSKVTVDTYGRVTTGASIGSSDVTTALGFTPVNKAGDVMTGAFGLNSITTAAETTLTGGFSTSDKGKMWFNSDLKKIHMWDGSAVESIASPPTPTVAQDGQSLKWNNTTKAWDYFTAGAAGAGIGTFNTLTANTQTLATGTGGTAPNWNSATSTHTLNIPLASTASVTAGLISKADYDNFNTKVGTSYSLAGDVTGTPASTSVDKIKGKAVTTPTASGQMLVYDGTGITPVVMSSDATMTAAGALTLKNTGTAGTYPKVTTDAQGRVISGTTLSASDIPSLDWSKITTGTPTTLAGYGITDAVGNLGGTPGIKTGVDASKPASPAAGTIYFATDTNKIWQYNSGAWSVIASATGAGGTITALTSDVSASGSGSVAATVNSVGGVSASNVASGANLANAATNLNTASAILKRDASGDFISRDANLRSVILRDSGSNTVTLSAPTTVGTSYSVKWPTGVASLAGQVLTSDTSGNLTWTTPSATATSYSGVLPVANGGTNSSTTLNNNRIMVSSGSAIVESAALTNGQLLIGSTGAAPVAAAITQGSGISVTNGAGSITIATTGLGSTSLADGKIWVGQTTTPTAVTPAGDVTMTNAGSFSVTKLQGTSVSSTTPTITGQTLRYNTGTSSWEPKFISMADLRSTITGSSALTSCTSGQTLTWSAATDNLACSNITVSASNFASQAQNSVFAGPSTGGAGAPAFRALASADLPSGIATTGTYKSVTVDTYGRVTAGTNPTTAAGYGITDAFVNGGNSFSGAATLGTNDNNTLGLKTNGTVNMTMLANGNVGIGTTAPNYKLDVSGNLQVQNADPYIIWNETDQGTNGKIWDAFASSGIFQMRAVNDAYNAASPWLQVTRSGTTISNVAFPNGNVGIGTTSPANTLDIAGTMRLVGSNANFQTSTTGQLLSVTQTASTGTNYGMVIQASGSGATNNTGIYATASGATNNYGVRVVGPAASANNWAIYADAGAQNYFAGNVGIGTLLPQNKLDVLGSAQVTGSGNVGNGWLTINTDKTADSQGYQWGWWNMTGVYGDKFGLYAYSKNNRCAGGLCMNPFSVYDDGHASFTGNVGIGTTSPATTLDVNGDITARADAGGQALRAFGRSGDNFAWSPIVLTNSGSAYNGGISWVPAGATISVGPSLTGIMSWLPNGNVGIGTSSPNAKLNIANNVSAGGPAGSYASYQMLLYDSGAANTSYGLGIESGYMWLQSGNGFKFYVGGTQAAVIASNGVYSSSDIRLKKDIAPLDASLDKILSLTPVEYNWKDLARGTKRETGFIAQDVGEKFPHLINKDDNGIWSLNYAALTSPIVKSIQELYVRWFDDSKNLHLAVEKLAAENADLKQKLESQKQDFESRLLRLEKASRRPASP